jgi:hypothetical protein
MAQAETNSTTRHERTECPLLDLHRQAVRLVRAMDEADKRPVDLPNVSTTTSHMLAGIECYGLTLRAQSMQGALFQVALANNALEMIRDDLPEATQFKIDDVQRALHSIASVLQRFGNLPDPESRAVRYYINHADQVQLQQAIQLAENGADAAA